MAAKLLHSLADDNPDLQKQIGCMTGIFQIFDRQHLVYGRGRPNQRRLLPPPPGNPSKFSNGQSEANSCNVYNQEAMVRNPNRSVNEKQRASTESSRASFSSSSRSSSLSSLDCGKLGQPDPLSMDRITFPETPSRDPVISQTSASPKMGRVSLDLRDVVKDSMYRDSRGSSVYTPIKDEASSHNMRHKDSSRPRQLSKSVEGSSADFKESLRVLAQIPDGPWYYNEKELPRLSYESKEGSIPKDLPRFSYDGRDVNRKIKDLPRLSLDSRESSTRSSTIDPKSSHFKYSDDRVGNGLQPSRRSGIVAKLMGLDTLPDTKPSNESQMGPAKTFPIEDFGHSLKPLRTADVCRPVRLPKSPRSSRKDPNSPRWRNSDAVMKPVTSSKIPIEPAPWKHMDSARASPKQASKQVKSSTSTLSTSLSVYGEIEKRLKDIEFKQSGKDLRALKQILEAMQAKGFLEGTKEEQSSRNDDQRFGSDMKAGMINSKERAISSKHRGSGSATVLESPIVIMKPAKLVQKSDIFVSSIFPIDGLPSVQRPLIGEVAAQQNNSDGRKTTKGRKDQGVTSGDKKANNRYPRVAQTSSKPTQVAKDNNTTLLKNSGSTSPRLQKKLEFDKRSRPPTPPDSNITKRQPNRPSTESCSPGGRRRPKNNNAQQSDEQLSAKGSKSRDMSCQEENGSMQSDTGVTRTEPLEIVNWPKQTNNDVNLRLSEEDPTWDLAISLEQPSPISVLDSCAYMEDSPSPVKQTLHALQADVITESNHNPEEDLWKSEEYLSTDTTVLQLPSEINRKKLQSIDNLVQKLRRLNSTHNEKQTDYIASLCENTNPDHRYISEILLASGLLLRDLSSGLTAFQLHPSGHPINPELFFVLEQTKASSLLANGENNAKSKPEKFHRKFIFDAVNEILAQKLALAGPPEPWLKPNMLARKTLNAQKLLRELCSEIEAVQAKKQDFSLNEEEEEDGLKTVMWEDVMYRSDNWTDFQGEVSGIVLDVERSIFKELVNEVIIGEANGRRVRPNRRCRQLFSK